MTVKSIKFEDNVHLDRVLFNGQEVPSVEHTLILKITSNDDRVLNIELTEEQLDSLHDAIQEYYFPKTKEDD